MTRNLRNREHPAPRPVSSYEVAPDFFNDGTDDAIPYFDTRKEFRDAHPYKPGMVVWLEVYDTTAPNNKSARKAFISDCYPERNWEGFLRMKYRVFVAHKTEDRFSKNFVYTWPGYIERGYTLATEAKPVST